MFELTATASANPNIALIKYWGNLDDSLNLPANGSISMNLGNLEAVTSVTFDPYISADELFLNGEPAETQAFQRVTAILDIVRSMAEISLFARVESTLNFPMGTGIASSAAGFAALAMAATQAAGLQLPEKEISRLARLGSGSACRSVPSGFVEWQIGSSDSTSIATSFAPSDHWNLLDIIVVLQSQPKKVGSKEGHTLAHTSVLQSARVLDTPHRLEICREAICYRNFAKLAEIIELDSNMMHAVMMTSIPPLLYWEAGSIALMQAVPEWRSEGIQVAYTLDAGPNVHLICLPEYKVEIERRVANLIHPVEWLISGVGGPARIVKSI